MTERQERFVEEYLIDLNAQRAYKTAYPTVKSDAVARAAGARLLANVNVRGYVDERLAEIQSKKTADAKEVMEYLTSVLRGESEAEIVVIEGSGEGCSDARRMKKAPDEKERLKAAELLGKRYSLFKDNVQHEGEIDLNISVDYGDADELDNTE